MGDLGRFLVMAAVFALGAWVHLEFEAQSNRAARGVVLVLLSMWVLLFVTGLTVRSAGPHRTLAHVFAVTAWFAISFLTGAAVAEGIRSRDVSKALPAAALIVALCATVAASNTGYLGRLSDRPGDVLRFRLLHQVLAPGALAAALWVWLRLNRESEGPDG